MLVNIVCGATVMVKVVVALSDPSAAVTVRAVAAGIAVGLTVNVRLLPFEPEIDVGAKTALTPVGKPEIDKPTVPLKPPILVNVTGID
jgi:hypothetical protein